MVKHLIEISSLCIKGKYLCQQHIKVLLLCGLHSVMKWGTRLIFQQGVINGETPCNFPGFLASGRVDDNQYDKCHQYNGSSSSNSPVKQHLRKPDNTATKWLSLACQDIFRCSFE